MRRFTTVTLTASFAAVLASACQVPMTDMPGDEPPSVSFPLAAYCDAMVIGTGLVDVENDYLPHVVACENGNASFEALKVQAVSARSYLYYKLETSGSIMDGTGDQVFSCGNSPGPEHYAAVAATAGEILTNAAGNVIAAFYVAGALQNPPACMGGTNDPTGTENYVTYNEGLTGGAVMPTPLGSLSNPRNRGCMSQNGADCLSDDGWVYDDILRFYYGADINIETAVGPCVGGPTPMCTPGADAVCGGSVAGSLVNGGSSDAVRFYSCKTWDYNSPEMVYELVAAETEPVTVSLTGLTADLDLFILDGGQCDALSCYAESTSPATDDEVVTFDAIAGETYHIVVEGWEGAVSDFTISFSCTPPTMMMGDPLPELTMLAEIAPIPTQDPDFVPDGDSFGIFDLYTTQPVTLRFYVTNEMTATDTARNVSLGLFADVPYIGIGRWDAFTSAGTCGDAWCPDGSIDDAPDQPSHDDPGADLVFQLGDIAPGETKMLVFVAVGLEDSSELSEHPAVGAWVLHADDVYDLTEPGDVPTLNVGQTWNGGDLSAVLETDVWEWTGEGRPPGGIPPKVTVGDEPGCGCRVVGGGSSGDGQGVWLLLGAPMALLLRRRRQRHLLSRLT